MTGILFSASTITICTMKETIQAPNAQLVEQLYLHNPMRLCNRAPRNGLECWIGIRQKLLEVRLEPRAGLRSRLQGIGLAAVKVVPR